MYTYICIYVYMWKHALPTGRKAPGNTQELTDQLFSACSQTYLAQWIKHASTKIIACDVGSTIPPRLCRHSLRLVFESSFKAEP